MNYNTIFGGKNETFFNIQLKKISLFFLFLFILNSAELRAQNNKKLNHWYFGYGVSIEWDCDGGNEVAFDKHPTIDIGGPGMASNQDGDFIFYVCPSNKNGQVAGIYDRTGTFMKLSGGGDADMPPPLLNNNPGGGAKCIQVSDNIWYACYANGNINYYSRVDMSLPGNGTIANPAGEVIEHITAVPSSAGIYVRHDNGKDHWLISVGKYQASAYRLSAAGFGAPVISTINFVPPGSPSYYRAGGVTFNPDVSKMAYNRGMADFDNATGIFSNHFYFPSKFAASYAFTADCKYLIQFDAANQFQGGGIVISRFETENFGPTSVAYDVIYNGPQTGPQASWGGPSLHNDGNMYFKNGPWGDLSRIKDPSSASPTVEVNYILLGQARTGTWNQFPDRLGQIGSGAAPPAFCFGYAVEVKADPIDTLQVFANCDSTVYEFYSDHCGVLVTSEEWFFGDGTSSSSGSTVRHAYTSAGTYEVQYVVRNDNTCSKWNTDTTKIIVEVIETKPEEPTILDMPLVLCQGDVPFDLSANIEIGDWRGTGIIDAATGLFDPGVSGDGIFEVIFETGGANCSVDDTAVVQVLPSKDATFNYSETIYCANSDAQIPAITGLLGGAFTASSTDLLIDPLTGEINIKASTPGIHEVTYTTTGTCPGVAVVPIEIKPLPIVNVSDTLNCEGVSYFIDFTGTGTRYDWTNITGTDIGFGLSGTGNISNYQANLPQPFTDTITVEVIPTNDEGCLGVPNNFGIVVKPRPVVSFNANILNGCAPLLVEFTNTSEPVSAVDCSWDFGDGATSFNCGTSIHEFDAGTFDVTLSVKSLDGCEANGTYADYINVVHPPKANFYFTPSKLTILETEVNFINISSNADSYEWNFGDGVGTSLEDNPVYEYTAIPTSYYATLWAYDNVNLCKDSVVREIKIHDLITYFVPNTFTPNGDGENQIFKPVFTAGVDPSSYHLIIFNRWGETLFESFNMDSGWDGSYGNQGVVKDGVYVWKIAFKEESSNKSRKINGHVTVLK